MDSSQLAGADLGSPSLTLETLRGAVVEPKKKRLEALANERNKALVELFYALRSKDVFHRINAGFVPPPSVTDDPTTQAALRQFLSSVSVDQLDNLNLTLPEIVAAAAATDEAPRLAAAGIAADTDVLWNTNMKRIALGAAPPAESKTTINELESDYARTLQGLPIDLYMNHIPSVTGSSKRARAPETPDLYKMNVVAKMAGNCLYATNDRSHNYLDSQNWNVIKGEAGGLGLSERIETLKNEKKWSFRQPRKYRTGTFLKAHWDYVLDEAKWLGVDFREEARWKRVCAYKLARKVKQWHELPPEERGKLCVRVAKRPASTASDGDEKTTSPVMDVDNAAASPISSGKEAASTSPVLSSEKELAHTDEKGSTDDIKMDVDEPEEAANADPCPPVAPAKRPRPAENPLDAQAAIIARQPVFGLTAHDTVLDLSGLHMGVGQFFADLPLYTNFHGEIGTDKRIDESSVYHSRLTAASHLFEARPLLVSTIKPSTTRENAREFKTEAAFHIEDSVLPGPERPAAPAIPLPLFSGKHAASTPMRTAPPAPPGADVEALARMRPYTSEEDALLGRLQAQYGSNWALIAHSFNTETQRGAWDARTAWDVYDRCERLRGDKSTRLLPDGREIRNPVRRSRGPGPRERRHRAILDAIKKSQGGRDAAIAKRIQRNTPPTSVNLRTHESHQAVRSLRTPAEYSRIKSDQDQVRLRQKAQQDLLFQHQRQNLIQRQASGSGAVPPQRPIAVPQGFPLSRTGSGTGVSTPTPPQIPLLPQQQHTSATTAELQQRIQTQMRVTSEQFANLSQHQQQQILQAVINNGNKG